MNRAAIMARLSPLFRWAKPLVTLVLLAYLLNAVDMRAAMTRVEALTWHTLAIVALIAAAQITMLIVRWRVVLGVGGVALTWRETIANVMIGLFFNQLLVSSVGGDAVRIAHLARLGARLRDAITLIVVDRFAGLLALMLLIALTLPGFAVDSADHPALAAAGWGLLPLVAVALAGWGVLIAARRLPLIDRFGGFGERVQHVHGIARSVVAHPSVAARVLSLALVSHAGTMLCGYALARGSGVPITVMQCFMLLPPVLLLTTLPISLGGWGVREGALVVAFGFIGLPEADAVVVGLSLGLWSLGQGLVGGLWWLIAEGRTVPEAPAEDATEAAEVGGASR